MVVNLPCMCEVIGSIPSTASKKKTRKVPGKLSGSTQALRLYYRESQSLKLRLEVSDSLIKCLLSVR